MSVFTIVEAPQELPAKRKERPEKPLSFFFEREANKCINS